MIQSRKCNDPPPRPVTFTAAEGLNPFELAELWADRMAWPVDKRTPYDELAELAVMSALARWLQRWQPIAIHSAMLAGAWPEAVVGALGDSLDVAYQRWHDLAAALGFWRQTVVTADRLDDPDYPAYTTGRAAEVLGVQQAFLRALDTAGAVTPERSAGGHRRYTRRQLAFAARIRELFDQGHSLASALRILGLQDDVAGLQDDLAAERARTARLQRQLHHEQGQGPPGQGHGEG